MGAVENDLGKKVTRFYVSTDGSNNNSGTSDLPFATVEYALNNVASGDTVIMQPGTYQESVSYDGAGKAITLASMYL